MKKKNVVIFASGKGSNALNIIRHFSLSHDIQVSLIVSNREKAGVLDVALENNIETLLAKKEQLNDSDFHNRLIEKGADLIVLAGFLLKIPKAFISAFKGKIINIHPSLLPKYGGKGMYGDHVHKAVLENQDQETGITVHWVNEEYDEGLIIEQLSCSVANATSVQEIREEVQKIEKVAFPLIIKKILSNEL